MCGLLIVLCLIGVFHLFVAAVAVARRRKGRRANWSSVRASSDASKGKCSEFGGSVAGGGGVCANSCAFWK